MSNGAVPPVTPVANVQALLRLGLHRARDLSGDLLNDLVLAFGEAHAHALDRLFARYGERYAVVEGELRNYVDDLVLAPTRQLESEIDALIALAPALDGGPPRDL